MAEAKDFKFCTHAGHIKLSSVLWHCCLGGRKGIQPLKTEWWDVGMVMSGSRCRFAYGPADATATHCILLQ